MDELLRDPKMSQNKQACAGLADMKQLFCYLELLKVTKVGRVTWREPRTQAVTPGASEKPAFCLASEILHRRKREQ